MYHKCACIYLCVRALYGRQPLSSFSLFFVFNIVFKLIHTCSTGNWLKHGIRGQPKVIIPFHQKNQDVLLAKILGMPSGIKNKGVGSTRRNSVAVMNANKHTSKFICFQFTGKLLRQNFQRTFMPVFLKW